MTWILVVYFAISTHHVPVRVFATEAACHKAALEYATEDQKGKCIQSLVYNRQGE